ncbi:MAG: exonuclease SbcCD subunit D C-terminal domain-containing protein [Tannerellaceae bacterium]|nr:exonuclease SbcCD subunit D C-terminal domain-containing protein [Tannerellaceae bacterium]
MALKLLHTADWHLGQTFFGYDREPEHDAFLVWLVNIIKEQQTDVLLITGDIFDVANPSAASQRRFFRFLREAHVAHPSLQILVTAGNHDSAVRLEAPVPLLEELNTHIVGYIRRTADGSIDFDALVYPLFNKEGGREGWCLTVPYLRQGDYPLPGEEEADTYIAGICRMYDQLYRHCLKRKDGNEAIIAVGHLHATGAELSVNDRSERVILGGLESVPVDAFNSGLVYTALGHIHREQSIGGRENVRYAGSPLPMSFSEINYHHQVVAVEIEKGEAVSIDTLSVPVTVPLLRRPSTPLPPAEVLEVLELLDNREDGDESLWPYLEVQVLLTEPDPGFRHRVEEVLATKAVRLTSIVPSYPESIQKGKLTALTFEQLQQVDPVDMLKHTFSVKYGTELPEELAAMFKNVLREVEV